MITPDQIRNSAKFGSPLRAETLLEIADRLETLEAAPTVADNELRRALADEIAIVDRIWALFGTPSYEELKGRSIYDLITNLQAKLAAETARADQWEAEADKLFQYAVRLLEQAASAEARVKALVDAAGIALEECEDNIPDGAAQTLRTVLGDKPRGHLK